MRALLSSPRTARRLVWLVALLAVAAAVAAAVVLIPGGKPFEESHSQEPAQTVTVEKEVRASAKDVEAALDTGTLFVATAVTRRHLHDAWRLTAPELRAGLTRKDWDKGEIPVVPYPSAGIATWRVAWTYKDDIGLDLVLLPKAGSGLDPKTFLIEMRHVGPRKGGRWLVAGWQPRGLSMSTLYPASNAPPPEPALGARWLLLPGGVVGLLVLALIAFALRGWYRSAQAMREYRSGLL